MSKQSACSLLIGHYVFRLWPFLSLRHFHGHFLSFLERLETFHLDCTMVYEYILSTFALNESKSLVVVEPLYGSRNSIA